MPTYNVSDAETASKDFETETSSLQHQEGAIPRNIVNRMIEARLRLQAVDAGGRGYWVTDAWEASLIDRLSGRQLAHIWEAVSGEIDQNLFVSPLRALRIHKRGAVFRISLISFLRLALNLQEPAASSLREAQDNIDMLFDTTG